MCIEIPFVLFGLGTAAAIPSTTHKRNQHILGRAPTQTEAWQEAGRQAESLDG